MKLQDLQEQVIWEDDEISLVLIENFTSKSLKVLLKGKAGKLIKDVDALAKKGIQKAGILGAFASDYLKRYKTLKTASHRSVAFYARNVQEKRAYEKMINQLKKSGNYRVVRTIPYSGGGRMWELKVK